MPRIQYVSSRGIFHFRDIDAPSRTIAFDRNSWQRQTRQGAGEAGGTSTAKNSPSVRAIVLNDNSLTAPPSTNMAPSTAIVDLTGSDDELVVASPQEQRLRRDHTERAGTSSNTNTSKSRSTPRQSFGNYSKMPSSAPSTPRGMLASKPIEPSGKYPGTSKAPQSSSKSHKGETIVLSDAEELPRFKMPRGLNVRSSQQSSSTKGSLENTFSMSATERTKRSFETGSGLSDTSHSSKKRKVVEIDDERRLGSNGTRIHLDSSKDRPDSTDKQETPSVQKASGARKASSASIDLTPPPRKKQKSRPVDVEDKNRAASSENRMSRTPTDIKNAAPAASISSSRRARDRVLSSDRDGPLRSPFGSQANTPRFSTPKGNSQPAPSESTSSRGSRTPHKRASDDINAGANARNTPRARRSYEDITGRREKQSQRTPTTDKVISGHIDSENRTTELTDHQRSSSSADQKTQMHRENEASQTLPASADKETDETREEGQHSSARLSVPPIASQPGRKSSSDDDQGYVSLGSSNLDESLPAGSQIINDTVIDSSAEVREEDSQAVGTTPDPLGGKMQLRASKTLNIDQNPRRTGVATSADARPAPELTRARHSSPENLVSAASSPRKQSPLKFSTSLAAQENIGAGLSMFRKDAHTEESPVDEAMNDTEIQIADPPDPSEAPATHPNTTAAEADSQLRSEAMQWSGRNAVVVEPESPFAVPVSAASALKSSSILSHLPLANQVERVLGKYLEELRGDSEYWTSISLKRARESRDKAGLIFNSEAPAGSAEEPTSFANLKPLAWTQHQKGDLNVKNDQVWSFDKIGINGKSLANVKLIQVAAPYTTFSTSVDDVPDYSHYVSIKSNVLAHNVTNLHYWPYFGDEYPIDQAQNLEDHYNLDIVARERKLLLLIQAQQYEAYAESAVKDLDCTWADVLRFLLEPKPDIGPDLDARAALEKRHESCKEDFSRYSKRWQDILFALPTSTPERLARVAVLCENFQRMANFSLWHVARRSAFATLPESDEPKQAQASDNELTCRICLRLNCPYHGQIKESLRDENDDENDQMEGPESVDSAVATDIVHPPKVNYQSMVAFPSSHTHDPDEDQKGSKNWNPSNFRQRPDERGPFYPCHHPGTSCENAKCSCYESKLPCEKLCNCAAGCPRKFRGCSCAMKGQKTVCFGNDSCVCYHLGRECDPDLCGSCGVCEVLDPVNKYDDAVLSGRCRNASMQRGIPKHTLLGKSGVHGFGLYTCEDIQANEFVGEYKGEIINTKEADRRGAVYEHQQLSYLFTLNKTQEIDSTYFGNKVRFINHAQGSKANLYPRIVLVNTVHRIALLANYHIRSGQELLFDYGPKFPDVKLGSKKSKKSAPRVRNSNLVKHFLDVEELEDEVGNVRAKGVAYPSSDRTEQKASKPRGGARPGAGRKANTQRQHHGDEDVADASIDQDAGVRLAAFNISDDGPSDLMEVDAEAGADDDDYFESEHSDSDDSEDSEGSGSRQEEDEDEDDDEIENRRNTRRRRGGAVRRTYR